MENYYKSIVNVFNSKLSELEKEQRITDILIQVKNKGIRYGQDRTIEAVVNNTERLRLAAFTQHEVKH